MVSGEEGGVVSDLTHPCGRGVGRGEYDVMQSCGGHRTCVCIFVEASTKGEETPLLSPMAICMPPHFSLQFYSSSAWRARPRVWRCGQLWAPYRERSEARQSQRLRESFGLSSSQVQSMGRSAAWPDQSY